jgi:hypothetical protein
VPAGRAGVAQQEMGVRHQLPRPVGRLHLDAQLVLGPGGQEVVDEGSVDPAATLAT